MLPQDFLSRLAQIFPPDLARLVERSFVDRPTTLRCNLLKSSVDEVQDNLKREGFTTKRVNWCREAFILSNRSQRELTKLAVYKEGKIYLQSLASMVPPLVLGCRAKEKILDMTAAPGSKTSQIAAMMGGQGELHAVELDKIRFEKLRHNMQLLGVLDSAQSFLTLHQGDATNIFLDERFSGYFDRILLDAPCSAEARILAKEQRSFGFWSLDNIQKRASEQRALLSAAWRLIRPGGIIVYSTCTFAPEENEVIVSEFINNYSQAKVEPLPILPTIKLLPGLARWQRMTLNPAVVRTGRIVPTAEIEGFFLAKIRKVS